MFAERPAPAVPACERLSTTREGCAEGSDAPEFASAAAGLSTAEGEVAVAAAAAARRGDSPGSPLGSIVGTAAVWARGKPPLAIDAAEPLAGTVACGCVRFAAGLFAAD
jgi:hypothetical protein